jgi:uncharacterized membrane protein
MPDPGQGGGTYVPPPAAPIVQSAGMEENVASALCYALGWITGVLFLVLEPYNKNRTVRFHAFQSIFFNIAIIPLYIVVGIFSFVLHYIPVIGPLIIMLMYVVLMIGIVGMWAFLIYKAYNKDKFVIPLIGPLAEKQAGA